MTIKIIFNTIVRNNEEFDIIKEFELLASSSKKKNQYNNVASFK